MPRIHESEITRAILTSYHEKLSRSVDGDVLVVGAGPSGLMAAMDLARRGHRATILEKRVSPGGGIWAGAMGMNDVVVQDEALPLLEEVDVRARSGPEGINVVDAMELASGLSFGALKAGATLLNLTFAEDLSIKGGRVRGVVANRTGVGGVFPVDPITLQAKTVLDATGHDAALVRRLEERGLLETREARIGEGPMNAEEGEAFVVDEVGEIFPGLWISGMCVAAALGGPRMGPIFGGMLQSGKRAAELMDLAMAVESDLANV